jgi:hypothetical protein
MNVKYNKDQDLFLGTKSDVMQLAIKAINLKNYTLDDADKDIGFIKFSTGMTWNSFSGASCSLIFNEVENNKIEVQGSGKQKPSGLLRVSMDLTGETKRIVIKVINKMIEIAN